MIGERIHTLRGKKGMTREALAEAVGVLPATIQNYEENRWQPGTDTLWRLASALDAGVTDIVDSCELIEDKNGDVIIVERNNGCRLKVVGVIRKGAGTSQAGNAAGSSI